MLLLQITLMLYFSITCLMMAIHPIIGAATSVFFLIFVNIIIFNETKHLHNNHQIPTQFSIA